MTAASAVPILETKLYSPRWASGLVTRPRLIERIRAGAQSRLTVVAAPAGSGKTTLLAEWLAQRASDAPPVAWVSLDTGDNEPALFWTCIIRALQKIDPDVGHDTLAGLQPGSPPSVAQLTALLNETTAIDCDVVLVLDDYHVIDSPSIHTSLAFFLDHLPPHVHTVLATRTEPPLPLARMRARGEVTELRVGDLRFTTDEAAAFLNRTMSLDIGTADVAALEQRTEGWIAGLKLAALSLRGHHDVRGFLDSFSGENRYVGDYLIEEVLQNLPERTRRFLLATSVLERLSASLCNALTGEGDAQAQLEYLEKNNLFVVALDDRREWYRYHHLFADVLQAHATRADAAQVREAHRRASSWYEHNGAISDAVRHAHAAGDHERIADLLECNWPARDRSYESARWLARVQALPEALLRERPVLNTGYAWALLNAGELEAAGERLRDVEASVSTTGNTSLAREVATARVYLAQSRGDFAGSAEHAQYLLEMVPADDHINRATAAALRALALWADGQLEPAYHTFASALASMRAAGAELDAIRGEFVPGDIRTAQGKLGEAERIYEAGIALAAKHARAETDELYLGLSEVKLERGELDDAERLMREMESKAPSAAHMTNRHRWCTVMARIAQARGDWAGALDLLDEAEMCQRRDPLPVARPVAAMRARIRIAQGDVARATAWMKDEQLDVDDALSFIREYEHITVARLLIARGELEPATSLLERLTAAASARGRAGGVRQRPRR